ncbi:hypothetical protein ANO11243_027210 [Dothideomycetidae sp. 11243]|nr:hypothetical protein ANO11243_027210 [fungal sp. No.11243]
MKLASVFSGALALALSASAMTQECSAAHSDVQKLHGLIRRPVVFCHYYMAA